MIRYVATLVVGTLAAYAAVELYHQLQQRYAMGLEVRLRGIANDLVADWSIEKHVQKSLPWVLWQAYEAKEEAAKDAD